MVEAIIKVEVTMEEVDMIITIGIITTTTTKGIIIKVTTKEMAITTATTITTAIITSQLNLYTRIMVQ